GDSHDSDRIVHALGGQRRAVDRIYGNVAFRTIAVADFLAVVKHRRFVLLAFTDDDDALHRHGRHELPHGIHRGCVGTVLVAAADPPTGSHGSRFGDPDQLEREVAVRSLPADAQRAGDTRVGHEGIVSTYGKVAPWRPRPRSEPEAVPRQPARHCSRPPVRYSPCPALPKPTSPMSSHAQVPASEVSTTTSVARPTSISRSSRTTRAGKRSAPPRRSAARGHKVSPNPPTSSSPAPPLICAAAGRSVPSNGCSSPAV